MKKTFESLLAVLFTLCGSASFGAEKAPVDYVNMFIGSCGPHVTEYGGTTPAVSDPFGMTQWCAATRLNKISATMYHHADDRLIGFMGTHQPAIWMGDYGYFTMMPQSGALRTDPEQRAVPLERDTECGTPYYYTVSHTEPDGSRIRTEFTATSRSSFFRFAYADSGAPMLMIEAGRMCEGGGIEIIPERNEIRLYNKERFDAHLGPRLYRFACYYVLRFSEPFADFGTWTDGTVSEGRRSDAAPNVGGYVRFASDVRTVEVRIGSSFIDYAQAADNLDREIGRERTFEQVKASGRDRWNRELSRVSIKGASEDDLTVFYTAFFRTLQYPREFSEYGRYYSPSTSAYTKEPPTRPTPCGIPSGPSIRGCSWSSRNGSMRWSGRWCRCTRSPDGFPNGRIRPSPTS